MTYIFPVQLYHKLTAVEPFTLSQTLHILSGFAMEFVFPVVPFPTCTVFPKTGSNSCSQNILLTIMEESQIVIPGTEHLERITIYELGKEKREAIQLNQQ